MQALLQREFLEEGEIEVVKSRSVEIGAAVRADKSQRGNLERVSIEELVVALIRRAGTSDLVWTRGAASDSVEHGVAEAGEVVRDAERCAGIQHENSVHLPA